jgi:glycyl-radical enzyme activating protein family
MNTETSENANTKALVYDIQRFCLHDGPGVRTTVFFKGCPLRCPWCSNPESISPSPEIYHIRSKCIACGECVSACKEGCLELADGELRIDRGKCAGCFSCVAACPTRALVKKGEETTAAELLRKALADRDFYDESGGGVTVSGGEPLSQPRAVAEFLRLVKAEGLHTAMETSGFASREALLGVLPYCDLVYIDVKHADPLRHREIVGQDNGIIHDNLRYLAGTGKEVIVRLPLIPGYNMDGDSIDKLIALLKPLALPVEPLLFHQFGKNKYLSVGRKYDLAEARPLDESEIEIVREKLAAAGLRII